MQRIWHKYSPLFHLAGWIVTLIFTAGIVYGSVSGYPERISTLEKAQTSQEKTITRMDYNIQIIATKIGLKPLKPLEVDQ